MERIKQFNLACKDTIEIEDAEQFINTEITIGNEKNKLVILQPILSKFIQH